MCLQELDRELWQLQLLAGVHYNVYFRNLRLFSIPVAARKQRRCCGQPFQAKKTQKLNTGFRALSSVQVALMRGSSKRQALLHFQKLNPAEPKNPPDIKPGEKARTWGLNNCALISECAAKPRVLHTTASY